MTNGRRKLAELFGAWMDHHGYTQTDVAAMGGPSTTTQSKVRNSDDSISRQTQRQLDAVMGWPPGTAAGVLQGRHVEGVFTPTEPDTPIPLPAAGEQTPPGLVSPQPVGQDEEDTLLFARPDGLSDAEWEKVRNEAGALIQWLAEKAARERRMIQ